MMMKDGVLECVAELRNLRSVVFSGISKFTTDGLLEFVSRQTPANQGIRVMVDMVKIADPSWPWALVPLARTYIIGYANRASQADPDTLLSDDEVALVRESLAEKVGGTFEYTPYRGNTVRS
jgi:hypothetical protein